MTVKKVDEICRDFLRSSDPQVIAIKGDWGVGKTHMWDNIITKAKSDSDISLDYYSYVSLFGVEDINSLKHSIFENTLRRDAIGSQVNIETFKENADSVMNTLGRRGARFLKVVPLTSRYSSFIEACAYLSVKKTIICIDDLERRGSNLCIRDVLGLVSHLKEKKGCKIVFLFNKDKRNGDYEEYKEKVVDLEVNYSPDPERCSQIVFGSYSSYEMILSKYSILLGITNIRVLQKIKYFSRQLECSLINYTSEMHEYILRRIVLFVWSDLCSSANDDIPSIDFVKNRDFDKAGLSDSDFEPKRKVWASVLTEWEVENGGDLNNLLIDFVTNGYFYTEKLDVAVKQYVEKQVKMEKDGLNNKAWSLFENSFDDNQDEFVELLVDSFNHGCNGLDISDADRAVNILRSLGLHNKASEVIQDFIGSGVSREIDFKKFKQLNSDNSLDVELKESLLMSYQKGVGVDDLKNTLMKLVGSASITSSDEEILALSSKEIYCEVFRNTKGPELKHIVTTALKFARLEDNSDSNLNGVKKVKEALIELASSSKMNMLRVKKYGVDVGEN